MPEDESVLINLEREQVFTIVTLLTTKKYSITNNNFISLERRSTQAKKLELIIDRLINSTQVVSPPPEQ